MSHSAKHSAASLSGWPPLGLAAWTIVAAFGAYFCMYAFRKPFTAASFDDESLWGIGEKTVLVTAQMLGYLISKFIGIRVIAEMPPARRAAGILILIGIAESALFLFATVPRPLHVACLFFNGLPLGMVFGLVLGFLEGRRNTEALAAGLCASFITADGVTRGVGAWLLQQGVTERWMPFLAGLVFVAPLLAFVWMLSRVPPPDSADVAHRSERAPMSRSDRLALLWNFAPGLFALLVMYVLLSVVRSMRADFAPEIWRGLGVETKPGMFALSETLVALGVIVVSGLSVLIVDNRRAFFVSLAVSLGGFVVLSAALVGLRQEWLGPLAFMVLAGLGLYLPYVAMHTTVFERLIAMTRSRGNLGFLMYVADSVGYLGFVVVIIGKELRPERVEFLPFFITTCWLATFVSAVCLAGTRFYFAGRAPVGQKAEAIS